MKIPIKHVLILGIIGLQVVSVVAIVMSAYLSTQDVLLGQARKVMHNVIADTSDHLTNFLTPAQTAVELTRKLAYHDVLRSADSAAMERYLFEQLYLYPQFAGLYFGTNGGDFFYVKRDSGKVAGGYKTKFITHDGSGRWTRLIWRDDHFNPIKDEDDPSDTYDPRERPWFKKAIATDGVIWTDPYVFYTSKLPGITSASTVYDRWGRVRGVVGVDIEIAQLSTFLATLKQRTLGTAFILNRNGDVIAHPRLESLTRKTTDDGQTPRFSNIGDLEGWAGQAAFASLGLPADRVLLDGQRITSFDWQGENYHAVFAPFPHSDWSWVVGVYVREDDFLGAFKANNLFNLGLAGVIGGLACLAGLIFAGSISRPISALRDNAVAVTGGALDRVRPASSSYLELQETVDAFQGMVESLGAKDASNRELTDSLRRARADLEQRVEERTADLTREIDRRERVEIALRDSRDYLERRVQVRTTELERRNRQLEQEAAERQRAEQALRDREARLRQVQAQLLHVSRLSDMGQLASALAHELNQPLAAIVNYVKAVRHLLGRADASVPDKVPELIDKTVQQSARASAVITGLRNMIEKGETAVSVCDINQAIEEACILGLVGTSRHEHATKLDLAPNLPAVRMDKVQVQQVVVNLVRNAVEAMSDAENKALTISANLGKEGFVEVTVADTGPGLPAGVRSRLYQPFVSTKAGGMGLGLSISMSIIRAQGGDLWVGDRDGAGAVFHFTLPIAVSAGQAA